MLARKIPMIHMLSKVHTPFPALPHFRPKAKTSYGVTYAWVAIYGA